MAERFKAPVSTAARKAGANIGAAAGQTDTTRAALAGEYGEVAEWFKAAVLKTAVV